MTTVYIVSVDGKVSTKGYDSLEKAQEFVKSRLDNSLCPFELIQGFKWNYLTDTNHIIEIHEVIIR